MNNAQTGKVILAGAGPGDPGLITVKLLHWLAKADVIITDRLVNPAVCEMYANPAATVLLAGKEGYNEASFTQAEVTRLIIAHALQGKTVLRLKGGDIAFFSNVLDELKALREHGIIYEIIPGITAAAGAAAYAGIPLTARGYAQAVELLTYNPNTHYSPEKWKYLANSNDTLVFYMSAKNITGLAELLLRYSKNPNTALAVIEQATTIYQQVHITTLKNCAAEFAGKQFSSPSLVVVGEVVSLQKEFDWFIATGTGSVFNILEKSETVQV